MPARPMAARRFGAVAIASAMAPASAAASPGLISQPVLPGSTVSCCPAVIGGGDDRPAHGLRLDGGSPESLRLERRRKRDVGRQIGRRHVVAMADQPHLLVKAGLGDGGFEFVAIAAAALVVAGQNDEEARPSAPIAFSRAAASIARAWPFQRVSRPASRKRIRPSAVVDAPPHL